MPRILVLLSLACLQLGLRADPADLPSTVRSPPAVIDPVTHQPWRYTYAFGFEVYSAVGDVVTKDYLRRVYTALGISGLPTEMRTGRSLPVQLILHPGLPDPSLVTKTGDAALYQFLKSDAAVDFSLVSDSDYAWVHVKISEVVASYGATALGFYIAPFQLGRYSPEAPPWLRVGVERTFLQNVVTSSIRGGVVRSKLRTDTLRAISDAADHPEKLIPLERFFNEVPPATGTPAYARWEAQAELLVRWGTMAEQGDNHDGFWKLAKQACAAPLTSQNVREAFRVDFDRIELRLARYLGSVDTDFFSFVQQGLALPQIEFRNASAAELDRVEGEWADGMAADIRASHPEQSERFSRSAEKCLEAAYASGDRDPRLLAALGLHYLDHEDRAKARPLLLAAAERKVIRPRVYVEVARLKLVDAAEKESRKLTYAQVTDVLKTLYQGREFPSPSRELYQLVTQVWESTPVRPSPQLFATLVEAVDHYPRDPDLALRIARLGHLYGYQKETTAILDRALQFPMVAELQIQLQEFRGTLATLEGK